MNSRDTIPPYSCVPCAIPTENWRESTETLNGRENDKTPKRYCFTLLFYQITWLLPVIARDILLSHVNFLYDRRYSYSLSFRVSFQC